MAGDDLNAAAADTAETEASRLVEDYLAQLSADGRLTADLEDEIVDGLWETVDGYRRLGLAPAGAARAAMTEFGCASTVATAIRAENSRADSHRLGRRLILSGPLVGGLWLSALSASAAPPLHRQLPGLWPLLMLVAAAIVVGAPAAAIAVAASRPWRRFPLPPTLAAPAVTVSSAAAATGDITILTVATAHVVLLHGQLYWPLVLLASAASVMRAVLAGRVVVRVVTRPSGR